MKKTYKNVSRSRLLLTCNLKDGTSLYIPYGSVVTLDDSQLTDYIKRRIAARDLREVRSNASSRQPSSKLAPKVAADNTNKE